MPGSITRRSECITAVMVLASTRADNASAAESAKAESVSADSVTFAGIVERAQREMWNIRLSPDVKLFKDQSFAVHRVSYLGALTRCNCTLFETCTKRATRQSGFGESPRLRNPA